MTRGPEQRHNQAPGRERVRSALDTTAPTGGPFERLREVRRRFAPGDAPDILAFPVARGRVR